MKKYIIAFCAIISIPCAAMAQTVPVIDTQWRAVSLKMANDEASSCKHLSMIKKMNCQVDVEKQYKLRGEVPGTEEYIRKNYGSLSVSQLNSLITKLNREYAGKVRNIGGYTHPEPGEITLSMVQQDMTYLSQLIHEKGGMPDPLAEFRARRP
ncbi:hypothetical protein NBRC3299_2723 [Acetobacter pasteurianus NBRC 3299]|nr:hypothetical protein BBA71_13235 [Acetobacter pasteurianus]GCD76431.1 hypothetical protein NBRC3299_2723 [Acetobacter pasteurianus NBRC 3299]